MPFFFEHDKVFIWILGGIFVYKQYQNSRHCKSYRIPFGTLHYDTCKDKRDFKVGRPMIDDWISMIGVIDVIMNF